MTYCNFNQRTRPHSFKDRTYLSDNSISIESDAVKKLCNCQSNCNCSGGVLGYFVQAIFNNMTFNNKKRDHTLRNLD